eukprot:6579748-Prymnesium_polylepis.1
MPSRSSVRLPWWFALLLLPAGFLLGRLQAPPDLRESAVVPRAAAKARGSPLMAVTRQLATERRRLHELEERLDNDKADRKQLARQAIDVGPGDSGWPCGLRAIRTEAARLKKVWCAHAAELQAVMAANECRPPPAAEYFLLTFSPTVDSAAAKIHDNGGLSSLQHLPWLDAALAIADSSRLGSIGELFGDGVPSSAPQQVTTRGARAPPIVVDVGAHFGAAVSLHALSRGARVLAVEMQPLVARMLRLSAGLNGWQARLQLLEGAVGPRGAKALLRFNSSCENSASAAVRMEARGSGKPPAGRETAPPVVLDETLQSLDGPVAYLRVSVRGAEGFAISSMGGTISSVRRQPRLIGIELRAGSGQAKDVLERLYKHGYSCCPFQSASPLQSARPRPAGSNWTSAELLAHIRQAQPSYVDVRCLSSH